MRETNYELVFLTVYELKYSTGSKKKRNKHTDVDIKPKRAFSRHYFKIFNMYLIFETWVVGPMVSTSLPGWQITRNVSQNVCVRPKYGDN